MKKPQIIIAGSISIFLAAIYVLGWSNVFTVASVEIVGTDAKITSTVELGQKLARVEPREVVAHFQKINWIESVDVRRNWFDGKVTITIVERTPIAIYNNFAIDASGVSFLVNGKESKTVPRIQGENIESAIKASIFFASLPSEITDAVELLKIKSGDRYTLQIVRDEKAFELVWGRDEERELKIRVYRALLVQPENVRIARIDLSAPHAPIVK